jgi:hypothetical protein
LDVAGGKWRLLLPAQPAVRDRPGATLRAAQRQDVQRLWRMVCGERWRRVRGLASPGVVVLLGASISVAIGEVQWASILGRLMGLVGG